MKLSKSYLRTYREDPANADSRSHALLIRSGMIHQHANGLFYFLPFGYRVLKKIIKIIREEMDRIDAEEVALTTLSSSDIWKKANKWDSNGKEMMKMTDRKDRAFALSPTAEVAMTDLLGKDIVTYRDLPVILYQITTKFRDEIRPRFGLIRSREFLMKDAYSFHADEASLDEVFDKVKSAYYRIFERFGFNFKMCEADSGAIGGDNSFEFIVMTDSGEAKVLFCECGYAANSEKARCYTLKENDKERVLELIDTPNTRTIEEVSKYLVIDKQHTVKSLIYILDSKPYLILIRGDRTLNEHKLASLMKTQNFRPATDEEMKSLGLIKGFIGPIGMKLEILADTEVANMKNYVIGANIEDKHYINVNAKDWNFNILGDVKEVEEGDICSNCEKAKLKAIKGIECGHIFKIGTKYSDPMGVQVVGKDMKKSGLILASYGIGVSRVMAAIAEQLSDQQGLVWPKELAPFLFNILIANEKHLPFAEELYEALKGENVDVALDDRDDRIGSKFKDSDLVGIPYKIVIGASLEKGYIELISRKGEKIDIPVSDFKELAKKVIEKASLI